MGHDNDNLGDAIRGLGEGLILHEAARSVSGVTGAPVRLRARVGDNRHNIRINPNHDPVHLLPGFERTLGANMDRPGGVQQQGGRRLPDQYADQYADPYGQAFASAVVRANYGEKGAAAQAMQIAQTYLMGVDGRVHLPVGSYTSGLTLSNGPLLINFDPSDTYRDPAEAFRSLSKALADIGVGVQQAAPLMGAPPLNIAPPGQRPPAPPFVNPDKPQSFNDFGQGQGGGEAPYPSGPRGKQIPRSDLPVLMAGGEPPARETEPFAPAIPQFPDSGTPNTDIAVEPPPMDAPAALAQAMAQAPNEDAAQKGLNQRAQAILAGAGFDTGQKSGVVSDNEAPNPEAMDGIVGIKTRAALGSVEKALGIKATGKITPELLAVLEKPEAMKLLAEAGNPPGGVTGNPDQNKPAAPNQLFGGAAFDYNAGVAAANINDGAAAAVAALGLIRDVTFSHPGNTGDVPNSGGVPSVIKRTAGMEVY